MTETSSIVEELRDTRIGVRGGGGIEKKLATHILVTVDVRATLWSERDSLNFGGRDVKGPPQMMILVGIGF